MIRTWDPQIRNLVLYPTELPGRAAGILTKMARDVAFVSAHLGGGSSIVSIYTA